MLNRTIAAFFFCFPSILGAQTCPANVPIDPILDRIHRQLAIAPTAEIAQTLTQALWDQWLVAPDPLAQDMLDTGMRLRIEGDLATSEKALDQLVVYCPDYAEGHNQRAFIRYLRGNFKGALPDLERALELRPRHLGAISGKGLTHMALGQSELAKTEFQKTVNLNPWSPDRRFLEQAGEEL